MKAIILLSAGIHPRSGASMPVPVELQAIALAQRFGYDIIGLHAGPNSAAVADCLGHGLSRIIHLQIAEIDDPLAALAVEIGEQNPELVLAGRRGQGGADSGLLPYRLAHACGMPIAADAVELESGGAVVQALPRGAKRRLVLRLPAVVTVHYSAPWPCHLSTNNASPVKFSKSPASPPRAPAFPHEDHPYRRRPKLIGDSTAQKSSNGKLMINPTPEQAAAAILDYLEKLSIR